MKFLRVIKEATKQMKRSDQRSELTYNPIVQQMYRHSQQKGITKSLTLSF